MQLLESFVMRMTIPIPAFSTATWKQCKAACEHKPYDGYIVGVPHKMIEDHTNSPSWLPKFLGVARADLYDKIVAS